MCARSRRSGQTGGADPYMVGIAFVLMLIMAALALGDYIRAVNALYYMRRAMAGSLRGAARMIELEPWAQAGVLRLDTERARAIFHELLAENLGLDPRHASQDGGEVLLHPGNGHPYLEGPLRYQLQVVPGSEISGLRVRMRFHLRLTMLPMTPHYCLETISYPTELGRPVQPGSNGTGRCRHE